MGGIMKYKGETFNTVEGVFNKALELTDNEVELSNFFKAYIQHIYEEADDIHSLEEAKERAVSNFVCFLEHCRNKQEHITKILKKYGN